MSIDTILDHIGDQAQSLPRHIFINSVNSESIHNGFIMTNTVEDELFLSLAGQIFLTPETQTMDYGLNTRNLFDLLCQVYGPVVESEKCWSVDTSSTSVLSSLSADIYFLQEYKLSSFPVNWCNTTGSCKYGVKLNDRGQLAMYSNGLPNWPPKLKKNLHYTS